MNNIQLPPAGASPQEIAAAIRELARLHPNYQTALRQLAKDEVLKVLIEVRQELTDVRDWNFRDGASAAIHAVKNRL